MITRCEQATAQIAVFPFKISMRTLQTCLAKLCPEAADERFVHYLPSAHILCTAHLHVHMLDGTFAWLYVKAHSWVRWEHSKMRIELPDSWPMLRHTTSHTPIHQMTLTVHIYSLHFQHPA